MEKQQFTELSCLLEIRLSVRTQMYEKLSTLLKKSNQVQTQVSEANTDYISEL